jgi:hypothetical protein
VSKDYFLEVSSLAVELNGKLLLCYFVAGAD